MSAELKPDICVIGGGAGGIAVATGAAQLGAKVVLIERGQLGGDNLNRGTIPSKALIAASRRAQDARQTRGFGITPLTPVINFRAVAEHIQSVIAAIAPNESAERLAGFGVQVLRGFASFGDRTTVAVNDQAIVARHVVVATGSAPAIPALEGLAKLPFLTNETLFANTTRFDHLIVLGGSGTAFELAQAYLRLGSRVTLIADGPFLPEYDPELIQPLLARLREEGMVLAAGVTSDRVEASDAVGGVRLHVSKDGDIDNVVGSHLLVAGGRTANIEGLELLAAGIKFDQTGIRVSRHLRTSNRQVYAVGDVTGGPPYATLARHQANILVRRLALGAPVVALPQNLPAVVFTDPELARVGMSETEARARYNRSIRVLRWPFSQNDRAIAERRTEGLAKIIAGPSGRILGATIVGQGAGDLIQTWSLAVSSGLTVAQVSESIAAYPTFAETSLRAAQGYTLDRAAETGVRGALRLLPGFG